MKTMSLLLLATVIFGESTFAQDMPGFYVDSALKNNIVLQQKDISLSQATYALQTARGMFFPSVEFQGAYQTAGGGRDIPLPLGDLLNGVYSTLNQLTQTQQFPQLNNEKVNFFPTDFYDIKVRTTVPIYNAQLRYNRVLKEQQVRMNAYDADIYKRQLIREVKTAYYNYLEAMDAVDIYQSALALAGEGKRVNERLLENGKGLPAYVLRAESEMEAVDANVTEARQNGENARRYFNFLLNRDQESEIILPEHDLQIDSLTLRLLSENTSISYREELKALDESVGIHENIVQMDRSVFLPSLNGFVDLGSQAENWKFNSQSRYYMVGIQVVVPMFSGNRNRYKIEQASLDVKNSLLEKAYRTEQMELSSGVAKRNLLSAYHRYLSSGKQLEAATAYQRLIDRGYKEGVNTYIETIDARNQLTQARLSVSMNRYKTLIAIAAFERETATYPLP